MSEKKFIEVGYIEYPNTTLFYRSLKIEISKYPELEGKSEQEILEYVKNNAYQMASTEEYYDSLGEELADQDIVREKIPNVDSEIWAEFTDNDSSDDDEDYNEEDD